MNGRPSTEDFLQVRQLMKRMGAPSFNPMPPDQHRWPQAPGEQPLYRMWSCLCDHTINYGFRSEYAVDANFKALTIEEIAAILGMDEGNARRTWREGVRRGIWRNGTKAEGEQRLYLCGRVEAQENPDIPDEPGEPDDPEDSEESGEEKTKQKVCADLFPPYISKQIKKLGLSKAQISELWREEQQDIKFENLIRADFDATRRTIFAQRKDSRYQRYGLKNIREKHEPEDPATAAERKARQARVKLLIPLVAPVVEKSAQTFFDFARTDENESAQTAENSLRTEEIGLRKAERADATLLYSETEKSPEKTIRDSAVSSPSIDSQILPSVGRSVLAAQTEPTDRPNGGSENPFKPKIREWLEANVSIPGFGLEEPELDEIAVTIHSQQDFQQFQEATLRQKNPRGWKVCVKIARSCQENRGKYSKAASAGNGGGGEVKKESYLERRVREMRERENKNA
jgi:hypothetical protein